MLGKVPDIWLLYKSRYLTPCTTVSHTRLFPGVLLGHVACTTVFAHAIAFVSPQNIAEVPATFIHKFTHSHQ
jgi:hypothetical protein